MIPRSGPFCRGANMITTRAYEQTAWTPERVAIIRKLWAGGHSASDIARHIGGATRCAVLGKLHRLGLSRAPAPRIASRRKGKATSRVIAKRFASTRTGMLLAKKIADEQVFRAPDEILAEAARSAKRVTFADLEDCHCRYPLWETDDEPRHYCGADKFGSLPYCESHSRLCFQIPEPVRKTVAPAKRELEIA